jgi:hypothetical protein
MAVRILMLVAVLLGDPAPVSPSYGDLLGEGLRGLFVLGLIFLFCIAVLLTVLYLIHYLIQFRTVLMANKWLLTAWFGLGVLFFVMVVVPGALLIYQNSGIGD